MAYDPEARKDSNTALIAAVAALILIIGAVAYFATRRPDVAQVPVNNTVVVQPDTTPDTVTNTVIEQVPANVPATTPPVVIKAPDRVIERNTTTTTNRVVVATPAPGSDQNAPDNADGARGSTNTNVTVNVPPSNAAPAGNGSATRAPGNDVNVEGRAGAGGSSSPAPTAAGY